MRSGWRRWTTWGTGAAMAVAVAAWGLGAAEPVPEREVAAPPTAVTVYPNGARVERNTSVDLPAGDVTVTFPDVPAGADENSLRLTVKGPEGTRFHGVALRSAFSSKAAERRVQDLKDRIRVLQDRKDALADRQAARTAELEILKGLAGRSADRQADGAAPDLAKLTDGTKAVGQRIQELLAASRTDALAQRDLDEQLGVLQQQLAQAGAGQTGRRIAAADLTLPAAGRVELTLAYQVADAGWTPVYDVTLKGGTKAPRIAVAFAGSVRQRSGEDWTGVALTLSTARPTAGGVAPDPTDWWLDLWRPQPVRKARAGYFAPQAPGRAMDAGGMAASPAPEVETVVDAPIDEAQVDRAEFATTFAIPTPATLPSGGEARRVGVDTSEHDASLNVVVVPRLAAAGFLEASLTWTGDTPLLPGRAQLFQDGTYVGTIGIPGVGPGESLTLGFGQDQNLKVERRMLDARQADSTLLGFGKASRRYRWLTTLTSSHPGLVTVEVREQLPRSRHADIAVEPLAMVPDPAAESADRPGLKTWRVDLKPGRKGTVEFGYVVKYPQNTRVSGLE